jgi:hypothetical protein
LRGHHGDQLTGDVDVGVFQRTGTQAAELASPGAPCTGSPVA